MHKNRLKKIKINHNFIKQKPYHDIMQSVVTGEIYENFE